MGNIPLFSNDICLCDSKIDICTTSYVNYYQQLMVGELILSTAGVGGTVSASSK
jgi:hypothetical protein